MSEAFTWAGMSSGPSSVCVHAKSSGTAWFTHVSKSRRTSGEAFSLSVSDAEVWRMCTCSRPTRSSPSSGSAPVTSSVTRWKPRGRGRSVTSRWVHIAHLRRLHALPVVGLVGEREELLQAGAVRAALGHAELLLVGVDRDVRGRL